MLNDFIQQAIRVKEFPHDLALRRIAGQEVIIVFYTGDTVKLSAVFGVRVVETQELVWLNCSKNVNDFDLPV